MFAVYNWEYFPAGHANEFMLAAEIDANGNRTDYEYNSNQQVTKILQPADAAGSPRAATTLTYDAVGLLASQTDPVGRVTEYFYDSRSRLVETRYNDGSSEKTIYGSGPDGNHVVAQVDRNGIVTEFQYDGHGRRVKTILARGTMDAGGNFTEITDPTIRVEETAEYLSGTNVPTKVVRAGDTTWYRHDHMNRVVETTVQPRAGKTLTTKNVYKGGRQFYTEDPYGRRTYFVYRQDGRLLRTVQGAVPGFENSATTGGGNGNDGSGGNDPYGGGDMYGEGEGGETNGNTNGGNNSGGGTNGDGSGEESNAPPMNEGGDPGAGDPDMPDPDMPDPDMPAPDMPDPDMPDPDMPDPDMPDPDMPDPDMPDPDMPDPGATAVIGSEPSNVISVAQPPHHLVSPSPHLPLSPSPSGLASLTSFPSAFDVKSSMFDVHPFFSSLDIGHSDLDIQRSATHFVMWQGGDGDEMYDEFGNPIQGNSNAPFLHGGQVIALTRGVDPDPNGKYVITDYIYDDAGNLIETIDGRGISSTTTYDSRGRAIEQVAAAGTPVAAKTETDYDANGNVIEVRSPRYFDANDTNGYQKAKTTMTYGGRNRLTSRTEAPGTTEAGTEQYTYTVDGRLDTRTDARGNDWQTIYHACCGRTQATIDPLGHGTITNNDYRGNVTHQATVSNVASHTNYHDPDDTKTLGEVTTRYDERGRPIARTTWLVPLAVVDPNNVPIAGLAGVPSSDGLTQRWFYDDDLDDGQGLDVGITVAKIDGSGSFTLNVSQLVTELIADGTTLGVNSDGSATVTLNGEDEISVSISDGAGRSVAQGILEQDGTAITWTTIQHDTIVNIANFGDVLETARHDALNHITRSRSDGAGRTIESVDAETFVSTFSSDANGNQIAVRDPNNVGQDCTFDALNRDVSCTDTQGDTTGKAYDLAGNTIKAIDAKSAETLCSFDARNRQVQCTNRIGSVTQWGYDANGNLLSLLDGDNHDANGDATLYTYDARNLKTSEAFPGHGPTSAIGDADYDLVAFSYDAARRISIKTDQQGDTATHNYDLAGRLTSRDYVGGPVSPLTGQSDTDTFAYDSAGRMTSATSGRYNNVVAMGYDNASRLVSESLTAYGQTYTVGSGFDAANRKTSITYPDGKVVNRGYSDRDQLAEIKYDGSLIDTRTYDNGGRLATSQYGNGIGTTWSYRNDNLVSSITRTNLTGADFTYTYDANKNKTSETISGVMAPYGFDSTGYDPQDRLTAWNRTDGALNQSWNLSKEGDWNSFTENGTTESRSHTEVHELTSIDTTPLLYDSKGNLTTNSNGQTYTWDFDNSLSGVDLDGGGQTDVTYTYDALWRRVGVDSQLLVSSEYEFLAAYDVGAATGLPSTKFIYEVKPNEVVVQIDNSGLAYYHQDQQESVSALTSSTGAVLERYTYDPYGTLTSHDAGGNPIQVSGSASAFGFTGQWIDEATGLVHFHARQYSPECGRFMSRDPISYSGGLNQYELMHGKVLTFTDPLGLDVYPYPDPDLTTPGNVGNVTVTASGSNLCDCDKAAEVIISVTVTWGGSGNLNTIVGSIGEIHIDRCRIPIPNSTPPTPPGQTSDPARFAIPYGKCSGGSGSTSVRIVDLTRSRLRPLPPNPPFGPGVPTWTGVAMIIRVSWDWSCNNDCNSTCPVKPPTCTVKKAFTTKQRLERRNVVTPNLPDPGPLRQCPGRIR